MIFTAKNFTLAFVPGTSKNGYCPADKNIYCTHANFSMENFQWGPFCISDENLYNKSNKKKIPVIFNHEKFLAYHSTTEKPYKCRKTTNIIPYLDQTEFTKAAIVMINMLRYKIAPGVRPNLKVGRIAEFTEIDQNKPYCSVKIDNTEDFFNVLGGIMTQFNFEVAFNSTYFEVWTYSRCNFIPKHINHYYCSFCKLCLVEIRNYIRSFSTFVRLLRYTMIN
jgi:hypothetical protein